MLELKKQYNELLKRFYNGTEAMEAVKGDKEKEEKYLKELEKIQLTMNDILMKIGEYTPEETTNGFEIIEEVKTEVVADNVAKEPVQKETEVIPMVSQQVSAQPVMNTIETYKENWKLAEQLSKSDLIPDTFKGKVENCIIALGIAQQTNLPPYTIMNNLNIVRGRASFSGSFCRTLIERTGKYLTLNIKYIGEKGTDSYGAYMEAIRKDGSIVKGPEVTIATAKQERMVF